MSLWNEGDRVRVLSREVTADDRKKNRYFDHMAGLVGTVQQVYSDSEVVVKVDLDSVSKVTGEVLTVASTRMRGMITSEEQKKNFTKEELEFVPNYVLLVQGTDLEKA